MRGDRFFLEAAKHPPFTKLHPSVAGFLKGYLANEKVVRFGHQWVVNTSFPPYPSHAFDNLAGEFGLLGDGGNSRLYSVTFAVTNRCSFNCWHCYNAGRREEDVPLERLKALATDLQDLGAVIVTLTGGEPLLRRDLEDIVRLFDDRSCVIVGTTGDGLTPQRARDLRAGGAFGVGISLDSTIAEEHDRMRGRPGAFRIAIDALGVARTEGLYPYVVAVATREFLEREPFMRFMEFAGSCGALEVHLLEPSAQGRLEGRTDVLLSGRQKQTILDYQAEIAGDDRLPILSSFTYLESGNVFGCGAGLTHVYIDGSGEVCPCNLVPLSFGNVLGERLAGILERMRTYFRAPRTTCVGRLVGPHLPEGGVRPLPPADSCRLCESVLPRRHAVPLFFRVKTGAQEAVGARDLQAAYNTVHDDYDGFWLTQAASPIEALVEAVEWRGGERVFEAGCGTGYGTALLARKAAQVVAADISEGMLTKARARLAQADTCRSASEVRSPESIDTGHRTPDSGRPNVRFVCGDALATLEAEQPFDVVFSSWVLGYIPLRPFFRAAGRALVPGGQLAFVVHRENSPREPMELFAEIVAWDPSILLKQVAFDFPRDGSQVEDELRAAGFEVSRLWEGAIVFPCPTAADVLEHLLKSGAGTAFHDAVDPRHRDRLTREFLRLMEERREGRDRFDVSHEYVACVARKP
jgi:MoaA/NifB/PqqE/SkfB family radical SAM enzyme/SAM-dependent methyltransferase